jgi:flagellar L-ring protein precursor FlgH
MKKFFIIKLFILIFILYLSAESLWDERGNIYSTKKEWKAGDTLKIIFKEDRLVDYRIALSEMQKVSTRGQGGIGQYINFLPALGASDNFDTSQRVSTKNKSSLQAAITVQILQVLPNGNLQVSGNHSIVVNNQTENIIITGEVNPKDIKKKKYVYSTDIINAAINYQSKIIKPTIIEAKDYIQTFTTNIITVGGVTKTNIVSEYTISPEKKNQLILEYLNRILSILFSR